MSTHEPDLSGEIPRRSAEQVMRLERLGSFHQSRLSFMRILTRRLKRERWTLQRTVFSLNAHSVGHAVYTVSGPQREYSLIAFSHDLPDSMRSDRVIATAWDATFVLFDGTPTQPDIDRLAKSVPIQEAGRLQSTELTLSRANRSVRLWQHVVERLAQGKQPDTDKIESVGYLMRTTAVYGSGKFGAADRQSIAGRAEFAEPFQAEMLTVYLIRTFVRDLVEHAAFVVGGAQAVALAPGIARQLGIGNSTGLGMAPFLINHPQLFNNWIMVREEALARVRNIPASTPDEQQLFLNVLGRVTCAFDRWHSEHPIQQKNLIVLKRDMTLLREHAAHMDLSSNYPWNRLYQWSTQTLGIEAQECLVSLLLEPYADLVDGMACCLSASDEQPRRIQGAMPVAQLRALIEQHYHWAISLNWQEKANCSRAWYVSEEKLEPRLGERFEEPIEPYEQPLAPARDIALLHACLMAADEHALVAELLLQHPEYRHVVRRVQLLADAPYAEIRDNTISESLIPFDMLRCKLSFFGATRFDPRSDRWLRISLYANAPYPEELLTHDADTWVYPDSLA